MLITWKYRRNRVSSNQQIEFMEAARQLCYNAIYKMKAAQVILKRIRNQKINLMAQDAK